MADRCHRLAGIEERFSEGARLMVGPEVVGIHNAAWQEQRVKILRPGLVERDIDRQLFAPIRELPRADLAFLRRYDPGVRTGSIEGLARLRKLDLLEAIFNENGYF